MIKCLKMITFLPFEEIEEMSHWEGAELNKAKEILAFEVTKQVHGEEKAAKVLEAARSVFSGGVSENMPEVTLTDDMFKDGKIDAVTLAVSTGLFSSNSDARRMIDQGSISVNKVKVATKDDLFDKELFEGEVIFQKGKKKFVKIHL